MEKRRLFRSEPQGTLKDALHVAKLGFIGLFVIVFAAPDIRSMTEYYFTGDPAYWVIPTVGLSQNEVDGVLVYYGSESTHPVDANFVVQTRLRSKNGPVICTGISDKSYRYTVEMGRVKYWKWDAFTERICPVPQDVFSLCLRYIGRGVYGTEFGTPFYCTEPFSAHLGEYHRQL